MSDKLLHLFQAANKNRLVRAMATGAAISVGTAYLGNQQPTWHNLSVWASAGLAGGVLAGINFVRNPQQGNETAAQPETTPAGEKS